MNIIKRYGPPNKMDQCPKGTICVVQSMPNLTKEYWEQISDNSEEPVWISIHDISEVDV